MKDANDGKHHVKFLIREFLMRGDECSRECQ